MLNYLGEKRVLKINSKQQIDIDLYIETYIVRVRVIRILTIRCRFSRRSKD